MEPWNHAHKGDPQLKIAAMTTVYWYFQLCRENEDRVGSGAVLAVTISEGNRKFDYAATDNWVAVTTLGQRLTLCKLRTVTCG